MKQSGSHQSTSPKPAPSLDQDYLLRLGECAHKMISHMGFGYQTPVQETLLFREAMIEAIQTLSSWQSMREWSQEREGGHDSEGPDVPHIRMEDLAQAILDHAFDRPSSPPAEKEQLARATFALTLDPSCSDAYILQGTIAEDRRRYQEARTNYERAMELAAAKLGPEVFQEKTRKSGDFHFWYSTGSRPYMRPRAALAYLLWQKLGELDEAIAHFREMLKLNPGDNQGNRYALICCLLEAGDDKALGEALAHHFTYTDEFGEQSDLRETCWHYTNACWLFRREPASKEGIGSQEAKKALRKAFTFNKHVPLLLLDPEELAHINDPGHYGAGDIYEANWYVKFSLRAWQQTQGALLWLESVARQSRLLPGKKKFYIVS